jgi:UDP-N-acetylmuramate--alanine ligase
MGMEKCHFIGIGGIGMSGLARLLLRKQSDVSGSDIASNYVTEELIKEGIQVKIGHSAKYITPEMTVVYSSDIRKDNPEFQAAMDLNCSLLHRSDLLAALMKDHTSFAIAGTHGKTTTSALLTWVLESAGQSPSFSIGGIVPNFQTNAAAGKGHYFVAEADESDGSFLKYCPYGAIVTNIDTDHMNFFKTESSLIHHFKTFMGQVANPDHLFWCGDDERLAALQMPGLSYGFSSDCSLVLRNFRQASWSGVFDVVFNGQCYEQITIPLTGIHNALNAAAVFGLALKLGIDCDVIRRSFLAFKGVLRRCEKKGETHGILFLDDYAHHPTEIETTLRGVRKAVGERRLVAVFQPHRYSRTADCLGQYGGLFQQVDELFITDIYAAGEAKIPGLSSQLICEEIKNHTKQSIHYIERGRLAEEMAHFLLPHDVVITLGAGDITKLSSEICTRFAEHSPRKYRVGIVMGGTSPEHEISLKSAKHISASLNREYYDLEMFGITKSGQWLSGEKVPELLQNGLAKDDNGSFLIDPIALEQLMKCDVLFPVLHGPNGEDGTIQGFFELLGKPYVGCCHKSSAVCMDKAMTKRLADFAGVSIVPFVDFTKQAWNQNPAEIINTINHALVYPLFVKPTHLGSSIGVKRVQTVEELIKGINEAFQLDSHVLVENGLAAPREIEFAVMGNENVIVLGPGEVIVQGMVFDYAAKYGDQAFKTIPKTDLTPEQIAKGRSLAERSYRIAGCSGMARVDFFLDQQGKFWLNEINPIPGFTKHSLYPLICAENGIDSQTLMDRLIIYALERKRMSPVMS